MSQFTEEWKPVVGFEGWYEASSLGKIRRLAIVSRRGGGKPLSPRLNRGGYPYIKLCTSEGRFSKLVHVLVAEAFLGRRPPKHDINHMDGKKENPRADNLEYVTRQENIHHAVKNGLIKPPKRSLRIPNALRLEILNNSTDSIAHLAKIHNLPHSTVCTIKRNGWNFSSHDLESRG